MPSSPVADKFLPSKVGYSTLIIWNLTTSARAGDQTNRIPQQRTVLKNHMRLQLTRDGYLIAATLDWCQAHSSGD